MRATRSCSCSKRPCQSVICNVSFAYDSCQSIGLGSNHTYRVTDKRSPKTNQIDLALPDKSCGFFNAVVLVRHQQRLTPGPLDQPPEVQHRIIPRRQRVSLRAREIAEFLEGASPHVGAAAADVDDADVAFDELGEQVGVGFAQLGEGDDRVVERVRGTELDDEMLWAGEDGGEGVDQLEREAAAVGNGAAVGVGAFVGAAVDGGVSGVGRADGWEGASYELRNCCGK